MFTPVVCKFPFTGCRQRLDTAGICAGYVAWADALVDAPNLPHDLPSD